MQQHSCAISHIVDLVRVLLVIAWVLRAFDNVFLIFCFFLFCLPLWFKNVSPVWWSVYKEPIACKTAIRFQPINSQKDRREGKCDISTSSDNFQPSVISFSLWKLILALGDILFCLRWYFSVSGVTSSKVFGGAIFPSKTFQGQEYQSSWCFNDIFKHSLHNQLGLQTTAWIFHLKE